MSESSLREEISVHLRKKMIEKTLLEQLWSVKMLLVIYLRNMNVSVIVVAVVAELEVVVI